MSDGLYRKRNLNDLAWIYHVTGFFGCKPYANENMGVTEAEVARLLEVRRSHKDYSGLILPPSLHSVFSGPVSVLPNDYTCNFYRRKAHPAAHNNPQKDILKRSLEPAPSLQTTNSTCGKQKVKGKVPIIDPSRLRRIKAV